MFCFKLYTFVHHILSEDIFHFYYAIFALLQNDIGKPYYTLQYIFNNSGNPVRVSFN